MAKKHLKTYIGLLKDYYSQAQELYEKCAEALSENLIDPDVYGRFCKLKNALDDSLRSWSFVLDLSLDRKNFLVEFQKIKKRRINLFSLLENLKNDPTAAEAYLYEIRKQLSLLEAKEDIFKQVDTIALFKNRSQKSIFNFLSNEIFSINSNLQNLEDFYKKNLTFEEGADDAKKISKSS